MDFFVLLKRAKTLFFSYRKNVFCLNFNSHCPLFFPRVDKEIADRNAAEAGLNTRVDTEIIDRENAVRELQNRMDEANENRNAELDDLRKKLMRENLYLKNLAGKPLSIYFDAYRTKAYDGGGEENLTFQVFILGLYSANIQR